MRLVNLSDAQSVAHPDFDQVDAGEDGVFEVDDVLGLALLRDAAHWREESQYLAEQAQNELLDLSDPGYAAKVLKDLRARIAELEDKDQGDLDALHSRIAELEKKITDLEDAATSNSKTSKK
jgi:cell division protein FtsB